MDANSILPPAPGLPIGHIFLMFISYTSVILYVWMIVIIIRYRSRYSMFTSAFYDLVINQAIIDLLLFLNINLLQQPRKYRMFSIFREESNTLLARISWYSATTMRTILCLGYLPFALNRFTIFYMPVKYPMIWTRRNLCLFFVFQWTVPTLVNIYPYFFSSSNFWFKILEDGELLSRANKGAIQFGTYSLLIGGSVVVVTCSVLYYLSSKFSMNCSPSFRNRRTEYRILICSVLTFIPMIAELFRNLAQEISDRFFYNIEVTIVLADLWYYTMAIVCTIQPWTLLAINMQIRNAIGKCLGLTRCLSPSKVGVLPTFSSTAQQQMTIMKWKTISDKLNDTQTEAFSKNSVKTKK